MVAPGTSMASPMTRPSWPAISIIVVAAGGLAYGYLDGEHHAAIALIGGMVLSGLAMLALVAYASPPRATTEVSPDRFPLPLAASPPPLFLAAACSISAGLIHIAVIAQHFEEYWIYGWFFIVTAVVQLAWALIAIRRPSRAILVSGLLINVVIAAAWIVTRSYGALVGPDAKEPAEAGFGDIWSTLAETMIGIATLVLLLMPRLLERDETPTREVVNAATSIAVLLVTTLAMYSAVAGPPFVSHVG